MVTQGDPFLKARAHMAAQGQQQTHPAAHLADSQRTVGPHSGTMER